MKKGIAFEYNAFIGQTDCLIKYDNHIFKGTSRCHPDDMDMCSERTGGYIAEMRAQIKVLEYQKKKIKPDLEALERFNNVLKTSSAYDTSCYAVKRLLSEIHNLRTKMSMIDIEIGLANKTLSEYIQNKDIMYRKYKGQN